MGGPIRVVPGRHPFQRSLLIGYDEIGVCRGLRRFGAAVCAMFVPPKRVAAHQQNKTAECAACTLTLDNGLI
jgi:hypothetical protein